jgi:Spy/CpxP family protein refolding chaperone
MDTKGDPIMKRILVFAGLAFLLATVVFGQHDGPTFHRRMAMHGDMSEHLEFVAKALDLTAEQKATAERLHTEMAAKAKPLMEQHHQQWREVHEMLDADNPDATAIGERMIAAHASREQLKAIHEEAMTRFSAVLNAEQLEKFKKFQEMHRDHDGEGHGFRMRRHGS